MSNDIITLNEIKQFLRLTGNEYDHMLEKMRVAAIEIASEYLGHQIVSTKHEAITQGIMTHVSLMFDMQYISYSLPPQILQFYKPYMELKI